jgi:hypothetical protein
MTVQLVILAALIVAGIAGALVTVAKDGYQRIPTRRG